MDFNRNEPKRNHPDFDLLDQIIADVENDYREQVKEYKEVRKDFTAHSLIQKVENPIKRTTVNNFFKEIINKMELSNKIGSANIYIV